MLIAIIRIIGLELKKVSPTLTLEWWNRSSPLFLLFFGFLPFPKLFHVKNYSDLISPIYLFSYILSYLLLFL